VPGASREKDGEDETSHRERPCSERLLLRSRLGVVMSRHTRAVEHRAVPHIGLPSDIVRLTSRATHPPTALLYSTRRLARSLIRTRYLVRVQGASHVPARGPVILAGNHLGFLDGPLLSLFSPRPAHVMTKIEMFDGWLGPLLRAAGQIPVDRFNCDPAAIRAAVQVLHDGRALGIFPEGIRGAGDFRSTRPGAAYLALATGAPVVPVAIFGTRRPGADPESLPPPRSTIDLIFGSPLSVAQSPWPRTKRMVATTHSRLQAHLQRHLADDCPMYRSGPSRPQPLEEPR
jgi:1-acyl-sn-glycerol-3-phosphate acyltransferase